MEKSDLTQKLKEMYEKGIHKGEGVAMIHLFGIKYADSLHGKSADFLAELSELATGRSSYSTELRKGIKLAKFVIIK